MRNVPYFALGLAATAMIAQAAGSSYWVYVGTYTGGGSQGIYAWRFDPTSGSLKKVGLVAETPNPTFLAITPSGKNLYAVNEVGKGEVSGFAIDSSTGNLRALNKAGSGGSGPCHLSVDKSGRNVLTANYGSGSVALIRVEPDGILGKLCCEDQHKGSGPNRGRQEGPHAHSINITPDGRFAVAADLGTDQLFVYRFDAAKGELTRDDALTVKTAPGAGPRHFAFHPNGKFAFAINELNSTLTAYSYDGNGGLRAIESASTLPPGYSYPNTTAEVVVHPNGKTVYASNRGQNTIAVFRVDPATGKLMLLENVSTEGKTPRNFALDPTGNFLFAANQESNNVVVFRVMAGGNLKRAEQTLSVAQPVCIRFAKAE